MEGRFTTLLKIDGVARYEYGWCTINSIHFYVNLLDRKGRRKGRGLVLLDRDVIYTIPEPEEIYKKGIKGEL